MSNSPRFFLDVKRSVTGRSWQERLSLAARGMSEQIAQTTAMPEILARILAARGITADDAETHLKPALRHTMPDPSVMTDMDKAADRIAKAIERRERVAIFGDYDVDGAVSSALLYRFFAHFDLEPTIYIPDRIFEGYGPNETAIQSLSAEHSLIVTVDCGTNSSHVLALAVKAGTDVVVIDHHQVGGALPEVSAIVNPNRQDDLSGLGYLCAAGVVFMVLVAVSRVFRANGKTGLPDLLSLLDLVAMATVCDVVALRGLNRAFVKQGTVVARKQGNAGLAALVEASRLAGPISAHHLGFMLGPRINAGGRIGDASLGARLLTMDDHEQARQIAVQLDHLNAERQALEADMVAQAKATAQAELESASPPGVLVLASQDWHPGIVGLIASRLKDAFHRPTFAIALDGKGAGTGSARSISGIDIGALVRGAVDAGLAEKGGGHSMAAGITVTAKDLPNLRSYLEQQVGSQVSALLDSRALDIDAALSARAVNTETLEILDAAGPFGSGYPAPIFVLPNHRIMNCRTVGTSHLRITVKAPDGARLETMAFGAVGTPLGAFLSGSRQAVHLAGTISPNTWQGRTSAQFRIIDAAPAS